MSEKIVASGSNSGHCEGACDHVKCAIARALAASACVHCGKPIGYETPYCCIGDKQLAHAVCEEEEHGGRWAGPEGPEEV